MAYYDPGELESHYDPAKPLASDTPISDIKESGVDVKGILTNLATFTIATVAVKYLGKTALNVGVRSLAKLRDANVQKFAGTSLESISKIFKKTAGIADDVVENVGRDNAIKLNDVFKNIPSVNKIFTKYENAVSVPRRAAESFGRENAMSKKQLLNAGKFNELNYTTEKIRNFTKTSGSEKVKIALGAAEKWGTNFAKSVPVFYAVDRLINAKEYAGEKPSLLNIPGTAWDFAKFAVNWVPQDLLFGAAFKGLGLAKHGIGKGVEAAVKPYRKPINQFLDSANEKISQAYRGFQTYTSPLKPVINVINQEVKDRFVSHYVGRKESRLNYKKAGSIFESGNLSDLLGRAKDKYFVELKNSRKRSKIAGTARINVGGQAFTVDARNAEGLQSFVTAAEKTHATRKLGSDEISNVKGKFGSTYISYLHKQLRPGKMSTGGSILGRQLATRGEGRYAKRESKIFDRLQDIYNMDSREIGLVKNIWQKSTFGSSIFKSSSNASKMADYSHFNPVNLLKATAQLTKKISVNLPFMKTKLTPYDWIAGDTIFGHGVKNRTFDKTENYYLGPNIDTRKLLANDGDTGFMTFIDGKFLRYSVRDNKFVTPDEIRGKKYLLRQKSEVLQNIQGRERAVNDEDFNEIIRQENQYKPKKFRRLHELSRKMEIGAGFGRTESLYSRSKNYLERLLFGKQNNIEKAYDQINDKNFVNDVLTGYDNIKRGQHPTQILKRASESASKNAAYSLRDPRVMKLLADRTGIEIRGERLDNFLNNETSVLKYARDDMTTAPKKCKDIVERYDLGHKNVLEDITSVPKLGPALTGMDELRHAALEDILMKNLKYSEHVFGAPTGEFIKDLAKQTGFSKISLTAINNLGLNVELKKMFNDIGSHDISTLSISAGKDLMKKFKSKMSEFENVELMKLTTYLSNMTSHKTSSDRLAVINRIIASKMADTPYISIESGAGIAGTVAKYTMERLANMGGMFGFGMDLTKHAGVGGLTKYWGKRALQIAGLVGAYNVADTFVDANPLFNQTMLDEGISVAVAEQAAKFRLAAAKVSDLTGITRGAQYIEGLMPGSSTFLPGAVAGAAAMGPIGAVVGGFANRMVASYLNYDPTKNFDKVKDIYAGREKVAVRGGRGWELSKTPYEGGRISYYKPSWFHMLKSQYQNNPVLYGGKAEATFLTKPWLGLGFNPLGVLLDPYRLERKQYFARPYPMTAPAGEDMPLVGPTFASTVGKILKPVKMMHPQELQDSYNGIGGGQWDMAIKASLLTGRVADPNSSSAIAMRGGNIKPVNKYDMYSALGEQTFNFTEAAGLLGFISESTFLKGGVGEARSQLETANKMSSIKRSYWDAELGGMFGMSELIRRFIPRERKEIERRNPIKNQMPTWLPGAESDYFMNFKEGDPYSKIPLGEARLPGYGLESLRNIKYSMPGRASELGKPMTSVVSRMLGIDQELDRDEDEIMQEGTVMHRAIQQNLKKANLLIKAEADVYDVNHDISGHVDAIVKDGLGGGGKRALEIKTINAKSFNTLVAPKKHHISQLNFYLSQLNMSAGNIVYVNRDDPSQTKSFNVNFSKERLENDMNELEKSRIVAGNLLRDGVRGQNIGEAYSHLDRMEILGDVAPWSKEYKDELRMVTAQQKAGLLTQYDTKKINTIKQHRNNVMRRFDLYPKRFSLDQLMDPDPTYTQLNINENIKAAAEYSLPERAVGSIWEYFTHSDLPGVNKFFGYKTPLEHYQQNVMYGSKKSFWNKPYESFIDPAIRGALGQDDPLGGASKWAVPGFLLGGPVGAIGLGAAGAIYGGTRKLLGNTYIPGNIQKQRDVSEYFDNLNYEKNKRLYNLTGDDEYFTNMQQTMTGFKSMSGGNSYTNLFKATARPEKDYLDSFLKTTDPGERNEILKIVPQDLRGILKRRWGMGDNIDSGFETSESYFKKHRLPDSDWAGWSPNLPISDYQVQTMKQEGLDAHEVGLGWYEQERRIRNSPNRINPIDITDNDDNIITDVKQPNLNSAINAILRKYNVFGNVSVIPINNDNGGINLNVKVSVDRRYDMVKAYRGY